jgi:putative phage-type endonuclease
MAHLDLMFDRRRASDEDWARVRWGYTGGSDTPVICGANPWKSRDELFLEKTYPEKFPFSAPTSGPAFWGTQLEPVVARVAAARIGLALARPLGTYTNHNHPTLLATPDFFMTHDREVVGVLEVKTGGAHMRRYWEKGPAPWAYLQLSHYMTVVDVPVGWVAVLLGGQDFRLWRVERDEALSALIDRASEAFWAAVAEEDPEGMAAIGAMWEGAWEGPRVPPESMPVSFPDDQPDTS